MSPQPITVHDAHIILWYRLLNDDGSNHKSAQSRSLGDGIAGVLFKSHFEGTANNFIQE